MIKDRLSEAVQQCIQAAAGEHEPAEETKFHVHRSTLSMWSPVFEKMFTSDFVERDAKEIALPGKKADEIEVLLKIMYSQGRARQITGRRVSVA